MPRITVHASSQNGPANRLGNRCLRACLPPFRPLASATRQALARRLLSIRTTMARVTVEDCLEQEENRFALVVLAAQRTRQLMKGMPALVDSKNKAAVISLREIAKGKVHWHRETNEVVQEYVQEMNARV